MVKEKKLIFIVFVILCGCATKEERTLKASDSSPLDQGTSKNTKEQDNLISAAKEGQTEKVKALIAANVNVNAKGNDGVTALKWAIKGGYKEIVEALIAAKADVNIKDASGETALVWAINKGDKEIIRALIAARADFNVKYGTRERTALMFAINGLYKGIAEILVAAKAGIVKIDLK